MSTAPLRKMLKDLGAPEFARQVLQRTGHAIKAKHDKGFDTETDVYGKPFVKGRKAKGKTLTDTGKMRRRTKFVVTGDRLTVSNDDSPKNIVHNRGRIIEARRSPYLKFRVNGQWVQKRQVKIPKRQFFLEQSESLPKQYEEAIDKAVIALFNQKASL